MIGWIDGWVEILIEMWMDEWIDGLIGGWVSGCTDEWTGKRMRGDYNSLFLNQHLFVQGGGLSPRRNR